MNQGQLTGVFGRGWFNRGMAVVSLGVAGLATPVVADTLQLKDGKQLVGIIDPISSDDNQVTIRTSIGTLKVPRVKIERIEREENISITESGADLAAAEGKLDRAVELYEKALQAEPGSPRIQQKLESVRGQIQNRDSQVFGAVFAEIEDLLKRGEFDQAIARAQDLKLRAKEASAQAHCDRIIADGNIGLARVARDRVSYPDAERHYRAAMESNPESPIAQLELAELLQLSPSRKTQAIPYYIRGIELADKYPGIIEERNLLDLRFRLGRLYLDEKQFDKAADAFLEVMRLDKAYQLPQAVDFAVEAYSKIQASGIQPTGEDLERIISNLQSIIALKPTEQRAYLLLGRIYFDQQRWTDARDLLMRAVSNAGATSTPASQEALYYLGLSHRQLGELDEAATAFQTLLSQRAANYDTVCELAEVKLEQGEYERALELFTQALQLDQDKYRAYLGMGETQQKLQMYEEARKNLAEVVKRDPTNVRAQLRIAQSYFDEEKWSDTVRASQEAVKLADKKSTDTATSATLPLAAAEHDRMLAEAYTLMGRGNLNLNQPNLARENFEQALKRLPNYAPAYDGIGKTFQADGLHEDAEAYFLKAIAADPKNPDYQLSLGISWHQFRKKPEKGLPYYLEYVRLGGRDPNVRQWIEESGGTMPAMPASPEQN